MPYRLKSQHLKEGISQQYIKITFTWRTWLGSNISALNQQVY